jgi:hypothetical protein
MSEPRAERGVRPAARWDTIAMAGRPGGAAGGLAEPGALKRGGSSWVNCP